MIMKEKKLYLSEFWLKILALVFMTIDHIGLFLDMNPANVSGSLGDTFSIIFRSIGRIAMPLFLFMLAEGLHKSHDRGNYILRIAVLWAIIFVAELVLFFIPQTSMYSFAQPFSDLLACALFIYFLEKKGALKFLALLPLTWIILSYAAGVANNMPGYEVTWTTYFPEFCWTGYSLFGFLIFLGFYYAPYLARIFLNKSQLLSETSIEEYQKTTNYQWLVNLIGSVIFVLITILLWGIVNLSSLPDPLNMSRQTYALFSFLPLYFYNGSRGYDKKWWRYFNYFYYPVHIVFLALIFWLIMVL